MKDNLNGLATIKDVQKGINFDCGVISISNPNDSNVRLRSMEIQNISRRSLKNID